jgi:hypothetical protein
MDVEIFTLCDAATVSGGKLNILGSFDKLYSETFPFQHPDLAVAVKLRFDAMEGGVHVMEVRMIDLDGRPIIPSDPVRLQVVPPDGQYAVHMLINRYHGLPFHRPGEYHLDLVLDGEMKARIPLIVLQAPAREGEMR